LAFWTFGGCCDRCIVVDFILVLFWLEEEEEEEDG